MINLAYNDQEIQQRESDGYLNATQMCKVNGKRIGHWFATDDYKRYVEALSRSIGIPVNLLVVSKVDGKNEDRGTWIHPKLAIKLGRWISVDFELWCDDHIKTLIETGKAQISEPKSTPIAFHLKRQLHHMEHNAPFIPHGFFSVYEECFDISSGMARMGIELPINMIPDISVGKCWVIFLRKQGIDPNAISRKYPHTYPDNRGTQEANCYPEEYLPMFRKWFRETYRTEKLPNYINKNHPKMTSAIQKLNKIYYA